MTSYILIRLTDPETDFTEYLITKDLQTTLDYLSLLLKSGSIITDPLINYLKKHNKKFYDLEREIIAHSPSLEEINSLLIDFRNKSTIPEDTTSSSSLSLPVVEVVVSNKEKKVVNKEATDSVAIPKVEVETSTTSSSSELESTTNKPTEYKIKKKGRPLKKIPS